MQVEIREAEPGEVVRKLPDLVEALLKRDPEADDDLVKAVVARLQPGDHGHDTPATDEPAAERFWRWQVGARMARAGRDAFTRRYARISARLAAEVFGDDDLVKAWSPRGLWGAVTGALSRVRATLAERLARLRGIVSDEHKALAVELYGPDAVDGATLERLRQDGTLSDADMETAGQLGILGGASEIGSVLADDEGADDMSAPEARRLAEQLAFDFGSAEPAPEEPAPADHPPGEPPAGGDEPPGGPPPATPPPAGGEDGPRPTLRQEAAEQARTRGAQRVVGLGNTVGDDLVTVAIDSEGELAQERRRRIAQAVGEGIAAGDSRNEIRRRVVAALEGDYARDIDRIVDTETHTAMQQAWAERTLERFGKDALVAVVPSPSACAACLRLYTEGGVPRIFRLAELPPSSVNFRRKASDRVACLPPLHPWCGCHIVRVPAGWAVDKAGIVMPPKRPTGNVTPSPPGDEPLIKAEPPARPSARWAWGRRFEREGS